MTTDPRHLGGSISGPGGPYDRDAVVVDTRHAIIVDEQEVATIVNPSDGRRVLALLIGGRINRTQDRATVMLLESADGLAAFVSECIHAAAREGGDYQREFSAALDERWAALRDMDERRSRTPPSESP